MNDVGNQYQEIWVEAEDGQCLGALINAGIGWLTYLRHDGDAGFSSRNPDFEGAPGEMVEYRLDNGQVDHFPRACAYPTVVVERALEHFRNTKSPPTFVQWHNDSGDGRPILPREPRQGERSVRLR